MRGGGGRGRVARSKNSTAFFVCRGHKKVAGMVFECTLQPGGGFQAYMMLVRALRIVPKRLPVERMVLVSEYRP